MLERFMLLWLCISSLVAYKWPAIVDLIGVTNLLGDPFQAGGPGLKYVIGITMFSIGWLLPKDEVIQLGKRWPSVLFGTTVQYISMPLLAYLVSRALPLSDDERVGIVMVGCVPGAMASNVLTLMAKGNASYSVSLTTMATLVSPFLVPFWLLWLLREDSSVNVTKTFTLLVMTVVVPTLAGHLLGRLDANRQQKLAWIAKGIASLAILWIIAVVVGKNRNKLSDVSGLVIMAVFTLNLTGYVIGVVAGRSFGLPTGMKRALALEIGMQNAGLGTALASEIFVDRSEVLIPTALYTFGCMFTGTILAWFWSTRQDISSV